MVLYILGAYAMLILMVACGTYKGLIWLFMSLDARGDPCVSDDASFFES